MGCTQSVLQKNKPHSPPETPEHSAPLSLRVTKLKIAVEEDQKEIQDDDPETPFSVNRLISCPDLGPSIERSATPHVRMTFINVSDVQVLADTDASLVNWAEHAPITPK